MPQTVIVFMKHAVSWAKPEPTSVVMKTNRKTSCLLILIARTQSCGKRPNQCRYCNFEALCSHVCQFGSYRRAQEVGNNHERRAAECE
jgi:hypothetical protein